MIQKERWEKAKTNSKLAFALDKKIVLKLPPGWVEVFPVLSFCKICHRGIASLTAIQSPGGRSYYHKGCVDKSPLFKKMGGGKL